MIEDIRDPAFAEVVGTGLVLETLGSGFGFTEGPIWHPHQKHLTFSDMPGDHMRRWWPDGRIETFRRPSNKTNGNTYDGRGRMISCEHSLSRVTRTEPDGAITVLAARFEGKELNSPNDVVVHSDGSIWFTDPTYGRMPGFGVERPCQLDFRGFYRMGPDGSGLTAMARDFAQPNGLCFSPDERRLFVNDTERGHVRVFDIDPDGAVSGGRVWAELTGTGKGGPDGMKVDVAGNLYCTGPGGLHVFTPEARCLGVIRVPEQVANFTWGEDDLCSLLLTASTSLYRLRSRTPGRPLF